LSKALKPHQDPALNFNNRRSLFDILRFNSAPMHALAVIFPKPVPYAEAAALQERLVAARLADRIPDVLLLLEHPPVITLGIRAKMEHLLLSRQALARRRIALEPSPRGGDITYHAPGQLVLYPILHLTGAEADVHVYVHKLEEIAIRTAARFGVTAYRRAGKTGAWTDQGKLAAIGVRFKRWVTSHGMSFNVDPDLSGFSAIVPCGLHGEPVTALHALLGAKCPAMKTIQAEVLRQFQFVLGRATQRMTPP
jgi:lipoate-protein ligase B